VSLGGKGRFMLTINCVLQGSAERKSPKRIPCCIRVFVDTERFAEPLKAELIENTFRYTFNFPILNGLKSNTVWACELLYDTYQNKLRIQNVSGSAAPATIFEYQLKSGHRLAYDALVQAAQDNWSNIWFMLPQGDKTGKEYELYELTLWDKKPRFEAVLSDIPPYYYLLAQTGEINMPMLLDMQNNELYTLGNAPMVLK
jgi:hypothetical protein